MTRISLSRIWLASAAAVLIAAGLGCGDDITLPDPIFPNVVDTTTLAALTGTPVWEESALDVVTQLLVRVDLGAQFDFAFDLSPDSGAVLRTSSVMNLRSEAGIALQSVPFDSIFTAPEEGYVVDSVVPIAVGDVFVARSRFTQIACQVTAQLPRYGKFEVLAIDTLARTLELKTLMNGNCGYRDLEPGLPVN